MKTGRLYYLVILLINQITIITTTTTPITPNHIPAAKISMMASQLVKVILIVVSNKTIKAKLFFFINDSCLMN